MSSSPGADVGSTMGSQPASPPPAESRPDRSPVLGIVALVLACLAIAVFPVGSLLANIPAFGGDAIVVMNVLFTTIAILTLAALTVGIVAMVTRRGRTWALPAVIVTGLFVVSALALLAIPLLIDAAY